jgi:hypothetical protein
MALPDAALADDMRTTSMRHNQVALLLGGIAATLGILWYLQDVGPERDAVIAAALFLLLGFLLALLVRSVLKIESDLLLPLVVFLPLLVFLVLSGKIAAFNAGGLNVTLVVPVHDIPIPDTDIAAVSSPQHGKCPGQAYSTRPLQPAYLTLTLGACNATDGPGAGNYNLEDVQRWVDEDASSDDFKFLVILDEAGAFSAAIDARSAADLLASDDGQTFITAINDGSLNRETGMQYSELMFDALPDSATNIEALQEMGRRNLDALVVVYGDNRIKGILSREQVVSSMMLALVNSSTENGE